MGKKMKSMPRLILLTVSLAFLLGYPGHSSYPTPLGSQDAILNLAAAFKAMELDDPWLEAMEEYCSLSTSDRVAAELVATHHLTAGNPAKALRVIERVSLTRPGNPAMVSITASCLSALGRWEEAVALLMEGKNKNPDFLVDAAEIILSSNGDVERARGCLRTAITFSPGHTEALRLLASLTASGEPFSSSIPPGSNTESLLERIQSMINLYASGSTGPLEAIELAEARLADKPDFIDLAVAALLVKWETPYTMRARDLSRILGNRICDSLCGPEVKTAGNELMKQPDPQFALTLRILDLCGASIGGISPGDSMKFLSMSGLTTSFAVSGPLGAPLKSNIPFTTSALKSSGWSDRENPIPGSLSGATLKVSGGFLTIPMECVHGVYNAIPLSGASKEISGRRILMVDSAVFAIVSLENRKVGETAASASVILDPDREKGHFASTVISLAPGEPVPEVHFIFRGEKRCLRIHLVKAGNTEFNPIDISHLTEEPTRLFEAMTHELADDSWAAAETLVSATSLTATPGWKDLTNLAAAFSLRAAADREPESRKPRALSLARKSLEKYGSFEALKVLVAELTPGSANLLESAANLADDSSNFPTWDSRYAGTSRIASSMASMLFSEGLLPSASVWARRAQKVNPGDLNAALILGSNYRVPPEERFGCLRKAAAISVSDTAINGVEKVAAFLSRMGRHHDAALVYLGSSVDPHRISLAAGELLKAGKWEEAAALISSLADTIGPTREILRKAYLADSRLKGIDKEEILKVARMVHPGWKWAARLANSLGEVVPLQDLPGKLFGFPSQKIATAAESLRTGDLMVVDDILSVRIHPDLSWGAVGCTRTLVLSPEGSERAGELTFPLGAEILAAHCVKPDGTVLGAERIMGRHTLSVQGLSPGDLVVQGWSATGGTTTGTALDFDSLPVKFGTFGFAMRGTGVLEGILKVTCPAGFSLGFICTGGVGVSDKISGDTRTVVWKVTNLEPWFREPGAPPEETHAPTVKAGGGISWSDAGKIASRRLDAFCKPSAELEALAAKWSRSNLLELSKVKGLCSEVYKKVTGVSVNADFEGSAAAALETGRGNRLGVMKSCLDLMGITCEAVLVNPRLISPEPWGLPDPDAFSHCLLRLPLAGGDLWIDPASGFNPPGFLLEPVSGTRGLGMGRNGGRIIAVPESKPGFETRINVDGSIGLGGILKISYVETHTGTTAVYLRESFSRMDPKMRKISIETGLSPHYRGLSLLNWSISELNDPGTPLTITAIFNAPGPTWRKGQGEKRIAEYSFNSPLPGVRLTASFAEKKFRTTPQLVPATRAVRSRAIIITPPGMTLKNWAGERESEFGWYSRRDSFTPGTNGQEGILAVEAAIVIPMQIIQVKDYQRFAEFCRKADAIDSALVQGELMNPDGAEITPSRPSGARGISPEKR